MRECLKFYINGRWVEPVEAETWEVVNPATEQPLGTIAMGGAADVDNAVAAARAAFKTYGRTTVADRSALLTRVLEQYNKRTGDMGDAISAELGSPISLAREAQAPGPAEHIELAIKALEHYPFEQKHGISLVRMVPIGVCGLITPWNWPSGVILTKVIPALATGCTVVLKPSEYTPFTAQIVAEIMDAAEVPAGVFNMVFGDGAVVGSAISKHPEVDMVSITGSTRAGVAVAIDAAPTIKRVHQELGGKGANIILPSADLAGSVERGVRGIMFNSGQICSAPSRMIAPRAARDEVLEVARQTANSLIVGDPADDPDLGPVINEPQFRRVQKHIEQGVDEGATLVAGGPGRPDGLAKGYYVRPTVFADVTPDMTIAQEEIFGPVLSILFYDSVDEAIEIANSTPYALTSFIQGSTEDVLRVAEEVPAGQVYLNGSLIDLGDNAAPFGGLKQSGNGREWGEFGFEGFLEAVSLVGHPDAS